MRIVLIDSYPEFLEAIDDDLSHLGHTVSFATIRELEAAPSDMTHLLNRTAPDVLVVDLPPPYGRSLDFLARLRAAAPRTPVVILASDAQFILGKVDALDPAEVVDKPFRIEDLVAAFVRLGLVDPHHEGTL